MGRSFNRRDVWKVVSEPGDGTRYEYIIFGESGWGGSGILVNVHYRKYHESSIEYLPYIPMYVFEGVMKEHKVEEVVAMDPSDAVALLWERFGDAARERGINPYTFIEQLRSGLELLTSSFV